jgi:hypothetical protein
MDRYFPLDLFRSGIPHGLAGFNGLRLWQSVPGKQQALKKACLARSPVTGNSDISDKFRGKTHDTLLDVV